MNSFDGQGPEQDPLWNALCTLRPSPPPRGECTLPSNAPAELVEQLAGMVLSIEPDEPGLTTLTPVLQKLEEALAVQADDASLQVARTALADLVRNKGDAPAEALRAVNTAACELQRLLKRRTSKRVTRDAETVELARDFLQESGDGLGTADEILLNVETAGTTPEKVNALFRVFHTIKGVAGFLELPEVVGLAHATESLMDEVREGRCPLAGEALELVFRATAQMRTLLDALKGAVEASVEIVPHEQTPALVSRLRSFVDRPSKPLTPEVAAPVAAPEAPLPAPSSPSIAPAFVAMPSAPKPADAAPTVSKLRETVKVDLERVDGMVEMIGELIIVESMLKHAPEVTNNASPRLRNTLGQLGKISRDLQNAAMRMRTVPVHNTFQKMARLTREVARKAGKDAVLVTQGEGTEMDRAMVERLEDPLVHMVRNAVDHGLETPAERTARGKPATGTLALSASHKGGSIVVELTDDGRGLQREAILEKAVQKGLVNRGEALTDSEVFALIFAPGFSTAQKVTEVSGRGVGMDVVKRNVEGMRGRVLIESVPGRGSTFRLVLPLTLAIIDGMLVSVGRERYLIPSLSIVEALQPTQAMLSTMGERDELLTVRGQVMPMLRLSTLLDTPGAKTNPTEGLVVVVEGVGKRLGLLVDQLLAQQQVVIKALGQGVGRAELYSGAAILSDGCVGLILNVDKLCGLITYKHRPTRGDSAMEVHA